MTIDVWPSDLPTGVVCFYPMGGGRSGGGGFMSPPATGASTYGPRWTAKLDRLPLLRRETLLAARALQTRLEAGAKPIMLDACPGLLSPQVSGGTAMEAVLGADAVAGADEMQILLAGDFHALRGGEQFSADHDDADVGRRMYLIVELIDNADPAAVTVRIVPRLRGDLAADAVLDFIAPSCPMRLVDGFDLPTEHGRFSAADGMFEEWFDASPVAQTAGLRALTLSPATIAEGSAEDTFVGRLFGTTPGSTLTLIDDAGGRFKYFDDAGTPKIVAGATATDYDLATSHNITVRETLLGRSNSPRDTVLTIAVTDTGVPAIMARFWEVEIPNNNGYAFTALQEVVFAATVGGAHVTGGTPYSAGPGADAFSEGPANAFDGTTSQWARSTATGARIGIDYGPGNRKAIVQARITNALIGVSGAAYLSAPATAVLRYSDIGGDVDGDWTDFDSATYASTINTWVANGTRAIPEAALPAGTYRGFYINETASNGGGFSAIAEIELRDAGGVNFAPPGTDDANGRPIGSVAFGSNAPAQAFDLSYGTYWFASAPGVGSVGYMLGTPNALAVVAIAPYSNAAWAMRNFTVVGVDNDGAVHTLATFVNELSGWAGNTFKTFAV
jgi:hypothetical protein